MQKALIYPFLVVFLSITLWLSSCSEFRQLQKSDSWKEKYEAAIKYYENKDYYRANLLFEDIIPLIKGMEEGELAQFYNAYTYFHQHQYLLSSHYFKSFAVVYSRSKYAEEANYMSAYSLYLQSPAFNLDQSSTIKAVNALQDFINANPQSKYVSEANDLIDNLQFKREKKQFEIAKQYLKIRKYIAATESFSTFAQDYPDSEFQEEASYLKIKTQFEYANNSVASKQVERYTEVTQLHQEFIDKYPSSRFTKDSEAMYSTSVDKIRKLKEQFKSL